jgi:hypothetical protein
MKRLLPLLAVFLLAACIPVEDFGAYWEKARVDPALAGRWENVPDPDQQEEKVAYNFIKEDQDYRVVGYESGEEKGAYRVKTLDAGPYHFFLASGENDRVLLRYEATDKTLTTYNLRSEPAWLFFKEHFPPADDIKLEEGMPGPTLKIKVLSEDVIKMLAAIPAGELYWDTAAELVRPQGFRSSQQHERRLP